MHGHLVAVKVGIKGGANQRVQLNGLALNQGRFKRLNAEPVQRWRTVQHNRMLADHLIENIPNFRTFPLDHFFRLLDRRRQPLGFQTRIDKRLEQFQRHFLRQAALMQFQFGANNDHRAARIVNALAEQVLPEATLLAFQHVRQGFERAFIATRNHAATPPIVEQRIDGFLQHTLFIANDNVRRAQLNQPLQTVVPVDNAAIEVIQVRGRKTATIKGHERAQFRRNDRHDIHNHPFGTPTRAQKRFDNLQTLCQFFRFQFGRRLGNPDAQVVA